MKKIARSGLTALLAIAMLFGFAATGRAHIADSDGGHRTQKLGANDFKVISPHGHQLIKATVEDATPKTFTINVKTIANLGVNEDAPTFAVYTTPRIPAECGDFRDLKIFYKKPTKYTRVFDLSPHPDVLKAIKKDGCVVMRNIPPARSK